MNNSLRFVSILRNSKLCVSRESYLAHCITGPSSVPCLAQMLREFPVAAANALFFPLKHVYWGNIGNTII